MDCESGGVAPETDAAFCGFECDTDCTKKKFTDLPTELQLEIFSFFTPIELCEMIAPVCKSWWLLSKDASLWKDLNFNLTTMESMASHCEVLLRSYLLQSLKVKSYVSVYTLIHNTISLSQLKDIDLGFCLGLNKEAFYTLTSNCPLLEHVNLEGCSPGVEIEGISHIVQLKHLRSLNLSHCECVDDLCMDLIARNCEKLQLLNVDGITRVTDVGVCSLACNRFNTLHHLYLDGEELTDESMLHLSACKFLITLKLSFGESLTDITLKAISSLCYLRRFKLRRSPNITTEGLEKFFSNVRLSLLEEIEIDSLVIDDSGLENLSRTCKQLRSLSLPWCWEITDSGIKSVLENCCKLRYLDLLGLYQLTEESLVDIPNKLPNLIYLNLEQCNNVVDSVVKDLARKMPNLKVYSYYGDRVTSSDSDDETITTYICSSVKLN